jgi:hypothetical protein
MLADGSVLDFVHLVQLSFEDNEVSPSLSAKINILLLIFLKGINDLVEISGLKEELEVAGADSGLDLLNRVE